MDLISSTSTMIVEKKSSFPKKNEEKQKILKNFSFHINALLHNKDDDDDEKKIIRKLTETNRMIQIQQSFFIHKVISIK